MNWLKITLPITTPVLLLACASQPAPNKQLAESEAAVRAASELGAKGTPEAAKHLEMARMRMDRADQLMRKGENDSAKSLLEEAKTDADLAVYLTREQQAETNARVAEEKLGGDARQQTTGATDTD